jgi:hypothetical protein
MCQRRDESPFSKLPDECVYYILNMCRWDWVGDSSNEMRRAQKHARRLERQRLQIQAERMPDEAAVGGGEDDNVEPPPLNVNAADAAEDEDSDFMEESEEESEDDDDDDSSTASDMHAWGDHVNHRDAQTFLLPDSDDSDSDEEDMNDDELRHHSRFHHRGSLVHRQLIGARAHIFNVLNGVARHRHDTSV